MPLFYLRLKWLCGLLVNLSVDSEVKVILVHACILLPILEQGIMHVIRSATICESVLERPDAFFLQKVGQ